MKYTEEELHPIKDLKGLWDLMINKPLLGIDKTRTNLVTGDGNTNATVMVVGEAPGENEDLQGKPFIGKSGNILRTILKEIGFPEDQIYITNIVKSRPPENRDPFTDEIKTHYPILLKEIEIIEPLVIICVGRISGSILYNNGNYKKPNTLKSMRGCVINYNGTPLAITYHPAAIGRNPQWKKDMVKDITRVYNIWKSKVPTI